MANLRENKGILLITAFMVAGVLFVLSGAYVASAIIQSRNTQRQADGLKALYAAERGVEYAFIESRNKNWDWKTHHVNKGGSGDQTELIIEADSATHPISLTGIGATINTDGCYQFSVPSGIVEVKAYTDPDRSGEGWVLSRATVAGTTKILRFRIDRGSLFKYFFYYPGSKDFINLTLDGKGVAGVHVEGSIRLSNTDFVDISELSTGTSGKIMLRSDTYSPPFYLDRIDKVYDGKAPLPDLADPHQYNGAYPWDIWTWPPGSWPPFDWRSVSQHFAARAGSINGAEIPREQSTEWQWPKYNYNIGITPPATELDVQFYKADGSLADASYWAALKAQYPAAGYFDSDFWDTKIYSVSGGPSHSEDVRYLNTELQPEWDAWLETNELKDVVEKYDWSLGGIESDSKDKAIEQGLYLALDQNDNLVEGYLNGAPIDEIPSGFNIKQFFNTVRPPSGTYWFWQWLEGINKVLEVDIAQTPAINNGIIYIANNNVELINGKELPQGLTVVSPYDIYIKGNFNYDPDPELTDEEREAKWKPAAVVSNSYVYILSDKFNHPKYLPTTINPPEYPKELNFVNDPAADSYLTTTPEQWQALEAECKQVFGLGSTFDISSAPEKYPTNPTNLENKIRGHYKWQYDPENLDSPGDPINENPDIRMPDAASPTTVYAGVVSPHDISSANWDSPNFYLLERWNEGDLKIKGAFIQLGESWANDPVTGLAIGTKWPVFWANRVGSRYMGLPQYRESTSIVKQPLSAAFEYEERFGDPEKRPTGDVVGGASSLWQEVSDFNHHTP